MIKDMPLKSKFEILESFLGKILHDIRKDIRGEHLKQDKVFVQKYFGKNFIEKIPAEDLEKAYFAELVSEGTENLGSWMISKWILKHAEVYEFFVVQLTKVNPKFEEITLLSVEDAKAIASKSVENFGAIDTYIFSMLNSVAFPDPVFEVVKDAAIKELAEQAKPALQKNASITLEDLSRQHELEILKLTDRYEKRLQATAKKYVQDIEGLKKQLGNMQKKLGELKCC